MQVYTQSYLQTLGGCDRIIRTKYLVLKNCEQKRQHKFICKELYLSVVKVGRPANVELAELSIQIMS